MSEVFRQGPAAGAAHERYKATPTEYAAVAEIETMLTAALEQLRPELERGTYTLIIGDDDSGRVPAYMTWKAVKAMYAAQGMKAPELRFVAGGEHTPVKGDESETSKTQRKEAMVDHFAKMRELVGEKTNAALVVTDVVSYGSGMKVMC